METQVSSGWAKLNKITDFILKWMDGGHPYRTLGWVCFFVMSGSFLVLLCLFHLKYGLQTRRASLRAQLRLLFDTLRNGAAWYAKQFPYIVAFLGVAIACWGLIFSIVSGDPQAFARSGALVTLLGFAIAFLKSSYAQGVYEAIGSIDKEDAENERLKIVLRAETMAGVWGILIIIPGTLIWAYGDLISKRVEGHACEYKWRLAVHCCAPASVYPPPPSPPQKCLILFDWNSASLGTAAEGIIFAVAQDASKDANSSVRLVGHADASGTPEHNLALSKRRACAVRTELLKLGVNLAQMTTSFVGSSDPLVSPHSNTREALNRNVEVIIDYSPAATRGP
jgi:hypothetical protein